MLPTLAEIAMSCAAQSAAHAAAAHVPKENRGQIHGDVMKALIESKTGMFEHELAEKLDVTVQRIRAAIRELRDAKQITRRNVTRRRDDGQGFRKSWKYRAAEKVAA